MTLDSKREQYSITYNNYNIKNKDIDKDKQKKRLNSNELLKKLSNFTSRTNHNDNDNNNNNGGGDDVHFLNINKSIENINKNIQNNNTIQKSEPFMQRFEPIQTPRGRWTNAPSTEFRIPELPIGRVLMINILSTWGDPHYLGLMGIELFDKNGKFIKIANPDEQVWADPADINVLPEYVDDPRTVDNLFDGTNHTCDDLHAWLVPYTNGNDHFICIDMNDITCISMIRIWNYNKSRIHSYRGARYVEMKLDDIPIYKGEIKKALGSHSIVDIEGCYESILFTKSQSILENIKKNDPVTKVLMQAKQELEEEKRNANMTHSELRKSHSEFLATHLYNDSEIPKRKKNGPDIISFEHDDNDDVIYHDRDSDHDEVWAPVEIISRPMTGNNKTIRQSIVEKGLISKDSNDLSVQFDNSATLVRPSTAAIARTQKPILGQIIEFCIISNWGDPELVGICGLVALDEDLHKIKLPTPEIYFANFENNGQKLRRTKESIQSNNSPSIIVNGMNLTTDLSSMWSINKTNLNGNNCLVLKFDFKLEMNMKGLRIWNYNGEKEGTCCGVRHINIFVDGILCSSTVVRKAPGEMSFDYNQYLPFSHASENRISKNFLSNDMRMNVSSSLTNLGSKELIGNFNKNTDITRRKMNYFNSDDVLDEAGDSDSDEDTHTINNLGYSTNTFFNLCSIIQQYETPVNPSGCMIKFVINSTHGDNHYVGLNGLAIYDALGEKININPEQLQATPFRDINDLVDIQNHGHDPRCLENLVTTDNNTFDDGFMWLAPFAHGNPNTIFILMDEPVTISCIKIWNYSKTPLRGAKEFEIFIDDHMIFTGSLLASPHISELNNDFINDDTLNWGTMEDLDLSQSFLFTNNQTLINREKSRIPMIQETISFLDDGKNIMFLGNEINDTNTTKQQQHSERPMTAATWKIN